MTAGDVYRALWRHKLFIVVLTTASVLATWYATSQQTKMYEASTLVRVQQRIGDPSKTLASLQAARNLAETYATILNSGALDAQIRAGLPPGSGNVGSVDVSAEPVQELALLWVTASDEDPATAARVANAAQRALRGFVTGTGTLRDQVVTIKAATVPTSPASPNLGLNLALAFLLALIFNSALVLLFELFRDRLPEIEEFEEAVGYPVLATIPTLQLRELKGSDTERGEDAGARASTSFGRAAAQGAEIQSAQSEH